MLTLCASYPKVPLLHPPDTDLVIIIRLFFTEQETEGKSGEVTRPMKAVT